MGLILLQLATHKTRLVIIYVCLQPIQQHLSEFWDIYLSADVCDLVWSGCKAVERLLSHSNESILHPDTHTHTQRLLDG